MRNWVSAEVEPGGIFQIRARLADGECLNCWRMGEEGQLQPHSPRKGDVQQTIELEKTSYLILSCVEAKTFHYLVLGNKLGSVSLGDLVDKAEPLYMFDRESRERLYGYAALRLESISPRISVTLQIHMQGERGTFRFVPEEGWKPCSDSGEIAVSTVSDFGLRVAPEEGPEVASLFYEKSGHLFCSNTPLFPKRKIPLSCCAVCSPDLQAEVMNND